MKCSEKCEGIYYLRYKVYMGYLYQIADVKRLSNYVDRE